MKKLLCIGIAILFLIGCTGTQSPQGSADIGGGTGIEPVETEDWEAAVRVTATLVIEANGKTFYADLQKNPSADAFTALLNSGGITVDMQDDGNCEKTGALPWELVTSDEPIKARPGDVILYQGNRISICYDENSGEFTRLARIENVTKEKLLDVFGSGEAAVSFHLEWSE